VVSKHIDLVKKWLDDPKSLTQKQLKNNADAAYAAWVAASFADSSADALSVGMGNGRDYAFNASAVCATNAADWVKKYEELTGEFGEV